MNPKVSIIMSFYNAHPTVDRLVQMLEGQTYDNLDVLLIDDGTIDDSARIVDEAASRHDNWRVVHKSNSGVSDSRNLGLDLAVGDWVYFADADDWMVPDSIETLMANELRTGADCVVSDFCRVAKGLVAHKHGPAEGTFTVRQFLRYMGRRPADHYYSSLWNKLFKRSVIEEKHLRFDTRISFGEDHVFILNYLRAISTVTLIDRPLYFYIDTEDSLVHRGLNLVSIIKMKHRTFLPYYHLFKDEGLYETRPEKIRVIKYIFMPCMDHFVDKGDAPFHVEDLHGYTPKNETGE